MGLRFPKAIKKSVAVLGDEDIQRLQQSKYADIYNFLLNTGLRFSELAGLDCADIDFGNSSAYIHQNYYRGHLNSAPKTKSGVRNVPLNDLALRIAKKNFKFGEFPLFRNVRDGRISYNTIQKDFSCYSADFGLHSLRHTFATRLILNGTELLIVSNILGHASISVTADIYTHIPFSVKYNAVDKLNFSTV